MIPPENITLALTLKQKPHNHQCYRQRLIEKQTQLIGVISYFHRFSSDRHRLPSLTGKGQILSNITFHITPFITAPLKLSFGAFACLAVEKTFLCSLAASEEKGKKQGQTFILNRRFIRDSSFPSSLLIPSSILFYSEVINTLKKRGVGEKFSTITGDRHCDEKFVDFPWCPRL